MKLERMLIEAGAVLVKSNRHKVYELNGRRFTISHGRHGNECRDRHKAMIRYLRELKQKSH